MAYPSVNLPVATNITSTYLIWKPNVLSPLVKKILKNIAGNYSSIIIYYKHLFFHFSNYLIIVNNISLIKPEIKILNPKVKQYYQI